MSRFIVFSLALAASGLSPASPLPNAKPETVGVSSERLSKISEFAQRNVAQGKHAGVVTLVARHGKVVHFEATGQLGINNDAPMQRDTLFRIYSMTKPVTSVALMMLYEEGKFQLSEPVEKYLPAMANMRVYREDRAPTEAASKMTIGQVLTHTAGLSYGFHPEDPVDQLYGEAKIWNSRNLDEFVEKIAALPLRFEPGTRYHYSVATDMVGALVEKISGQSLETFFQQRIFGPLKMDDTFFSVPENKRERLATNHGWDAKNNKLSLLPPEWERPYRDTTLFSGGGGLVSTAMDYMVFCEMLRRGGSYNGTHILGPKTVQWMTMNHLSDAVRNEGKDLYPSSHLYPGQGYGLGVGVITQPGLSEEVSSRGEYSWGGAADTRFWIDPQEQLVGIVMTQLLGSPWSTRYEMKAATYQALTELAGQ